MVCGPITSLIPSYARDAPKFCLSRPQELPRFLQQMEDMWNGAGVVDDEERKCLVGRYADQQSEDEWSALETYRKGYSWLEFRTELLDNYPEVAAAERGTPARLRQLCLEQERIGLGDLGALYAFWRAFLSEAKKLLRAPAVMSNRELVEMFIGSLSEPMALAVIQFLGSKVDERRRERRPEDQYDLEEVCRVAVLVSENWREMFYLRDGTIVPELVTDENRVVVDDVPTSKISSLAHRLEILSSCRVRHREELEIANRTVSARLSSLTNMLTLLLEQVQGDFEANETVLGSSSTETKLRNSGKMLRWGGLMKANGRGNCFYCGQVGHVIPECDEVKRDVY